MPPERFFLIASFKYWQTSHNCFCSVADNDVAISTAWIHLQYSRSLYILHGSEKLFKLSLLFCNMKTTKLSESVNCKTNKQKSLSCSDLRFISLLVNSFIFSCVQNSNSAQFCYNLVTTFQVQLVVLFLEMVPVLDTGRLLLLLSYQIPQLICSFSCSVRIALSVLCYVVWFSILYSHHVTQQLGLFAVDLFTDTLSVIEQLWINRS